MLQKKEQGKNLKDQINEEEIGNLPEKEFIIKYLKLLSKVFKNHLWKCHYNQHTLNSCQKINILTGFIHGNNDELILTLIKHNGLYNSILKRINQAKIGKGQTYKFGLKKMLLQH